MASAKELLPIGSVIRLREGVKKLMVIGVKQIHAEQEKEYDYLGVLYPEGNIGIKFQYFFDHENIEEIYFRGYESEEREQFVQRLTDALQKRDVGKISGEREN